MDNADAFATWVIHPLGFHAPRETKKRLSKRTRDTYIRFCEMLLENEFLSLPAEVGLSAKDREALSTARHILNAIEKAELTRHDFTAFHNRLARIVRQAL